MENKLVLKQGVKKYAVSITLLLFVLFILWTLAPSLSATRDDALNAQRSYESRQNLINHTAKNSTPNHKLDSALFEIKRYEVRYQTNETETLQKKIKTLKAKAYIIFDKYNESKEESTYVLKVKREKSQEVLAFLEDLSPQKTHLYVENIKKSIDSSIDEEKLLKEKLAKLEIILNDATQSYSALLLLAKEKNNIDALTKLIDLKINTLNRLSRERNAILAEIYTLSKGKQELFDSLNYVIFNINIDEFLYIDTESLKNSWKYDVKALISNFNSLGQSLTTTLASFIIKLFEFFIYFVLMLFILKIIIFIIKKVFSLENVTLLEKVKEDKEG
jgi:Ca2+/Na+ antiporter